MLSPFKCAQPKFTQHPRYGRIESQACHLVLLAFTDELTGGDPGQGPLVGVFIRMGQGVLLPPPLFRQDRLECLFDVEVWLAKVKG